MSTCTGQHFVTVRAGRGSWGSVVAWCLTLTKSQPPCCGFTTQQLDYRLI